MRYEEVRVKAELDFCDVKDLAQAIRLSNRAEAEAILDRICGGNSLLREAVSQGRYSTATRKAA